MSAADLASLTMLVEVCFYMNVCVFLVIIKQAGAAGASQ